MRARTVIRSIVTDSRTVVPSLQVTSQEVNTKEGSDTRFSFTSVQLKHAIALISTTKDIFALDLSGLHLDDDSVCQLAAAIKKNPTIHTIDFSSNRIGDKGVKAIAEALENRKNVCLTLSKNNIGPDGASALANKKLSFKKLNLNGNPLCIRNYVKYDFSGVAALASVAQETIQHLVLTYCSLNDEGTMMVINSLHKHYKSTHTKREIEFAETIGQKNMRQMIELATGMLNSMRNGWKIKFNGTYITNQLLSEAYVERFELNGWDLALYDFRDSGIYCTNPSTQKYTWYTMSVLAHRITSGELDILTAIIDQHFNRIRKIRLSHLFINDEKATHIANMITKGCLHSINLSHNEITDKGLKIIIDAVVNAPNLQHGFSAELDFSHNKITAKGAKLLAESCRKVSVSKLNLSFNNLCEGTFFRDNDGVKALLQYWQESHTLEHLNLDSTHLDDDCVAKLPTKKENATLTLFNNQLSPARSEALSAYFSEGLLAEKAPDALISNHEVKKENPVAAPVVALRLIDDVPLNSKKSQSSRAIATPAVHEAPLLQQEEENAVNYIEIVESPKNAAESNPANLGELDAKHEQTQAEFTAITESPKDAAESNSANLRGLSTEYKNIPSALTAITESPQDIGEPDSVNLSQLVTEHKLMRSELKGIQTKTELHEEKLKSINAETLAKLQAQSSQLFHFIARELANEHADTDLATILANQKMKAYYCMFLVLLRGTWQACETIYSGFVDNGHKTFADYFSEFLAKAAGHIPFVQLGLAAMQEAIEVACAVGAYASNGQSTLSKAKAVCNLVDYFSTLANPHKTIRLLAQRLAMSQKGKLDRLTTTFPKNADDHSIKTWLLEMLHNMKQKGLEVKNALTADGGHDPVKAEARKQYQELVTAIMQKKLESPADLEKMKTFLLGEEVVTKTLSAARVTTISSPGEAESGPSTADLLTMFKSLSKDMQTLKDENRTLRRELATSKSKIAELEKKQDENGVGAGAQQLMQKNAGKGTPAFFSSEETFFYMQQQLNDTCKAVIALQAGAQSRSRSR